MSKISIEGNLQVNEDSSSDEESEEEIEVFSEEPAVAAISTSSSHFIKSNNLVEKNTRSPGNNLCSAMSAAIDEVISGTSDKSEKEELLPPTSFEMPKTNEEEKPQEDKPTSAITSAPDAFGIVYKPFKKPSTNNKNMLSFEDEKEFTRDLLIQQQQQQQVKKVTVEADDDDEFDFDTEPNAVDGSVSPSGKTLDDIIQGVASRVTLDEQETILKFEEVTIKKNTEGDAPKQSNISSSEETSSLNLASLSNAALFMSTQVTTSEIVGTNTGMNTEQQVTSKSILAKSKEALDDIKNSYRDGLGDVEVRQLLDESEKSDGTCSDATTTSRQHQQLSNPKSHAPLSSMVIEEGDEDEEEKEELEEEENRKAQEAAEKNLETQWDSVNDADLVKGKGINSNTTTTKDIDLMQEFDDISTVSSRPDVMVSKTVGGSNNAKDAFKPTCFSECLEFIRANEDLSVYQSSITIQDGSNQSSSSLGGMFGLGSHTSLQYVEEGTSATSDLKNTSGITKSNHELPFLLAQLDYEPTKPMYLRALQTIYDILVTKQYTTTAAVNGNGVSAMGKHWEDIGFQGIDPRTDVNRSMKMFAVLQVLSLCTHENGKYQKLALKWHKLSGSYLDTSIDCGGVRGVGMEDTTWPFFCVSIQFTKEAVQALRSGVLNAKCNKHKDFFYVLQEFYMGLFHEFDCLLTDNPAIHHAMHLATIRKLCEKNPLSILKKFKVYKQQHGDDFAKGGNNAKGANRSGVSATKHEHRKHEEHVESTSFDNLENIATGDDNDVMDAGGKSKKSLWSMVGGGKPTGKAAKFAV